MNRGQRSIIGSMKRSILTVILLCCGVFSWATEKNQVQEKPFDRGIGKANSLFIPKGTIGGGLAVSYSSYQLGNGQDDSGFKMLFSMLDNINGTYESFGTAPYLSYFVADNLALGLRFDYDRTGLELNNMDLALGDMLTLNLNDINMLRQSYSGSLTLRYYMPIADSKRFAMFAEARATGAYAQSKSYTTEEDRKVGTYQDIYKGSLSVVPGICCFVTNEAALEVSVGVLGFTHQKTVQTTNQVEVSQMVQNNASFKINLLSINLGVSIYIAPNGKKSGKQ